MAAVDHERVLVGLKEHILLKRSHGQDELLRVIADLEVESRIPEGQEAFDGREPRPLSRNGDEDLLRLEEQPGRDRAAVA